MMDLSPTEVFEYMAVSLPPGIHGHFIVVGSVAAAYHFFKDSGYDVRTKDVDCVLRPREEATDVGSKVVTQLESSGWTHRSLGDWGAPRLTPEPRDQLSAIRLQPPDSKEYFVELLTVGETEHSEIREFVPVRLPNGEYYALASFRFLRLVEHDALKSHVGIAYARPSLMALANLLAHAEITHQTMSTPFNGRTIKRCNKDIGRTLALAWLDDERLEDWAPEWIKALRERFPTTWPDHAKHARDGLVALLSSDEDIDEALWTWRFGLLSMYGDLSRRNLTATGERLIGGPLAELERVAQSD